VDIVSKKKRSEIMSRITSKNTKPELLVRKELHRKGYRFRLHDKKLPGKPDIVLRKYKTVCFVNGCFWHRKLDERCSNCRVPKTNKKFWKDKFISNINRDENKYDELEQKGWNVTIFWECDVENPEKLHSLVGEIFKNKKNL
jgi:DNA mismatch endonuclease, patch repair protein